MSALLIKCTLASMRYPLILLLVVLTKGSLAQQKDSHGKLPVISYILTISDSDLTSYKIKMQITRKRLRPK